ncbi:asparagine synthase-related protein [Microtetraspora sp. NBRC 16547]|uniref:asparagine synthase-related protein n=1 Tax=Microtetraspora sp. NBRC 16547 TaxID=3030993 RepID=UPI002552909C|nr:asparagine synthase-related protein [Microtetraspora sp. NBRC 16547]
MRVHLGVAARRAGVPLPSEALAAAREAITRAFPVPAETVVAGEWQSARGDISLLSWSNEPEDHGLPVTVHGDGRVAGVTGHLSRPPDADTLLAASRLGETAGRTGGCFSVLRAGDDDLAAATGSTGACPIFYAETPEVHVVGTRALLVHLVAQAARTGSARPEIVWNLLALESMVRMGYFLSDETPFEGVTVLPPGGEIRIAGGRRIVTVVPLPVARPMPTSRRDIRSQVGELADALLSSVEPLLGTAEPVRLSLTGGRDSRLLAALLHGAGIPFVATTSGNDGDPDVELARRVAAALGVEHRVHRPKRSPDGGSVVVPHPLVRAHNVRYACEGMLSAYENVPGQARFDPAPRMSGHGGEILRAGFLHNQEDPGHKAVRRRMEGFYAKNADLLTERAREHTRALAAPWLARCDENPAEALDHFYVTYRVGRWHAASRASLLRTSRPIPPFLDNRVVRTALSMDPLWRRSEDVVHRVIDHFAPELRGIPIEGRPWRFEVERSDHGFVNRILRRRARTRPPVAGTAGTAGGAGGGKPWNWRLTPSEELAGLLREGVAAAGEARVRESLASLVEGDELGRFLAILPRRRMDVVWNLYTVATMMADGFSDPSPPGLAPLRIPRPG